MRLPPCLRHPPHTKSLQHSLSHTFLCTCSNTHAGLWQFYPPDSPASLLSERWQTTCLHGNTQITPPLPQSETTIKVSLITFSALPVLLQGLIGCLKKYVKAAGVMVISDVCKITSSRRLTKNRKFISLLRKQVHCRHARQLCTSVIMCIILPYAQNMNSPT